MYSEFLYHMPKRTNISPKCNGLRFNVYGVEFQRTDKVYANILYSFLYTFVAIIKRMRNALAIISTDQLLFLISLPVHKNNIFLILIFVISHNNVKLVNEVVSCFCVIILFNHKSNDIKGLKMANKLN